MRGVTERRRKVWSVMRYLGTFTAAEVCRLAEVEYPYLKEYMKGLIATGYVKKVGKDGRMNVYQLVRNTGPVPPVQKRARFMYDPNIDEYFVEDFEVIVRRAKDGGMERTS